ncbi:MAG TPA: MBL fold metallo-hydrolase [Candidatus Angelobacter sp.]|nr:MBL fold metallo-hydrolase [Candidatus Angelobacter sp.]
MKISGNACPERKRFINIFLSLALAVAAIFVVPTTIAWGVDKPRSPSKVQSSSIMKDMACRQAGAKGCIRLALEAMGGEERLTSIKSLGMEMVRHTLLAEQSYRQSPYITSYEHLKIKADFSGNRIYRESHLTWPESDPGDTESDSVLVAGLAGGVIRASPDSPCSLADLDWTREMLSLGAARLLLTAFQSPDLHFEQPELIRSTMHTVLGFVWQEKPVRIVINPWNHLPDAVETVEKFHDHWYQWGDVKRRIYFDNWKTFHGVVYPTNEVEERNGHIWQSTQVLSLDLNISIDETQFQMDAKAAERSTQSKGWERPFPAGESIDLAPGISLYQNSWNSTLVKQEDGIVLLEAPLSGTYTKGILKECKRRYPDVPIKAVLSTSDSWPHVGGVRQAVALGLPVYILDLNRPLLDDLVHAPHRLDPDSLAQLPKEARWRVVSQKIRIGARQNRMELYPLRGASTERQYMVYFPEHHLLYVSDTLSLDEKGVLYNPELMREVIQAVKREGLYVDTAFAMHQGPVAWTQIVSLVEKALK